ncbi:SHOCT domain-containing protein [Williamsia sp. M5A3_1d]
MTVSGDSAAPARRRGFPRVFLTTLAQMMLFGIVGPIFLVMYVVIDEPGIGWMLYWGVAVTAIDVAAAVVISFARVRTADTMARLEVSGVLAAADITAVEQTGVQINDQPVMRLSLRVHGDGIATFDASNKTVVPLIHLPVVNARRLAVLVVPGTEHLVIDWPRSALLSGVVPAVLTDPADGTTYDLCGRSGPLLQVLRILKAHGIKGDGLTIGDDPAARAEVMGVVRGVVPQSATGASADTPVASEQTVGQRLAELENLRVTKAITESEYATARSRILESL